MARTTWTAPVALALAAGLALAGCSTDDPAEFDGGGTSTAETEQGGAPTDEPTSEPPTSGAGGGIPDPGDVIAAATFPMPGSPEAGGTVDVGVHALQVEGRVMFLELYITPHPEGGDAAETWTVGDVFDSNTIIMLPRLNDRANLKSYQPLHAGGGVDGWWISTSAVRADLEVQAGETLVWWGYYAAPQDPVDELQLTLISGLPELTVPVQR